MVENIEFQPSLNQAKVKDGFWDYFQKLVLEQVIPYQERILRDEIPEIEKSHVIENFRIAAGLERVIFTEWFFRIPILPNGWKRFPMQWQSQRIPGFGPKLPK